MTPTDFARKVWTICQANRAQAQKRYFKPGGQTQANLATAKSLEAQVDKDLEQMEIESKKAAQLAFTEAGK
jgi:hypothetical protein